MHPHIHPRPPPSCPCPGGLTCLDCTEGRTCLLASLCMWPVEPLQETREREEREVEHRSPRLPPCSFLELAGSCQEGSYSILCSPASLPGAEDLPSLPLQAQGQQCLPTLAQPWALRCPSWLPDAHSHLYKEGLHSLLHVRDGCAAHFPLRPAGSPGAPASPQLSRAWSSFIS